jgi:hypothetical protein
MSSIATVLPKWIQNIVDKSEPVDSYLPTSSDAEYLPYASFSHWGWCEYTKRVGGTPPDRSKCHKLDSKKGDNIGDGFLSKMSAKKLKKAINFLIYVSKFKILSPTEKQLSFGFTVNFITLTLPSLQQHSDQFIKQECLASFLDHMKLHFGMYAYVWKAETQDNGNIHFHITTNVYIDHNDIRQVWNRIIEKYGYIDAYMNAQKSKFADGFKINNSLTWLNKKTGIKELMPPKEQIRRHNIGLRSGWRNPNSTDVHAIKQVSNLAGYLATYMGKKDKIKKSASPELKKEFIIAEKDVTKMLALKAAHPEIFKRPLTGQLWNCSLNLKTASLNMRITDEVRASLSQMSTDIAKVVFRDSWVVVYRFISGVVEKIPSDIGNLWGEFLSVAFPEIVPSDA